MTSENDFLNTRNLSVLLIAGVVAALLTGFFSEPGAGTFSIPAALVGLGVATTILFAATAAWLLRPQATGPAAAVLVAGAAVALLVLFFAEPGAGSFNVEAGAITLFVAVATLYVAFFLALYAGDRSETPTLGATGPVGQDHTSTVIQGFTNIPIDEEGQHVLNLQGIGAKYATRLNNNGIITIPQLLAADPAEVAQAVDVMPALVEEWQGMGRLIAVSGIGPQSAEMLALAGIRTVEQLAHSDPAELTATIDAIEDRRKVRVMGTNVTENHVGQWVDAATAHLVRVPA